MLHTKWEQLIERYAGSMPVCGCRQAYLSPCHEAVIMRGDEVVVKERVMGCEFGCDTNRSVAKAYVASKVLEELPGARKRGRVQSACPEGDGARAEG